MTNINLYLDDNRPAPPGWTLIKSGTKLVNFYQDQQKIADTVINYITA